MAMQKAVSMATGTSGDLLESSDHAQSVFKHEILRQYMKPFMAMLGSTAQGRRVVVVDGFAGRGRYPNGRPASAELILRAVLGLRDSRRAETYFIEKKRDNYAHLAQVVEEYKAQGLPAYALLGTAHEHLGEVVAAASGAPLFMFLDPCGALLPVEQLERILTVDRAPLRDGARSPATEVLVNFSADLTRRSAGQLLAGKDEQAGLLTMDRTCGGPWWRDTVTGVMGADATGSYEPVADAVADGYAKRLAQSCSMLYAAVPVRRRLHHQPIYHLIFLTRSQYGLWVFADALGKARQCWLQTLGRLTEDDEAQNMLFSQSDDMRWLVEREREQAQRAVEANIGQLLQELHSFRLVDQVRRVFGEAYGVATEGTVTAAVRALKDRDQATASTGGRARDRVLSAR